MSNSKVLLFILLSFISGIFFSSFFGIANFIIYEVLFLGFFYSLIFWKNKAVLVFGSCLVIFGLGVFLTNLAKFKDPGDSLTYREEKKENATISENMAPVRENLREIIYQNFSPPHSSIFEAMLLGGKETTSQEWKEKMNKTGVRHITAISGMNIVILSGILIWLALIFGLNRGQAFYFTLIFIWLYIFLIGLPSSAVRAGIMGSVFLFCQKIGRQSASFRALVLAASLMLLKNPLLLRQDVGFQLSFLATLGIIYLTGPFQILLEKIKFLKFFALSEALSVTFAAQVFTLPLLVYNFGRVSLISPIANILIVPLLPPIMVFGILFLFLGLIWLPLALPFSFLVFGPLYFLTLAVDFFAGLSFASVSFFISWVWLVVFYLELGMFVFLAKRKIGLVA